MTHLDGVAILPAIGLCNFVVGLVVAVAAAGLGVVAVGHVNR